MALDAKIQFVIFLLLSVNKKKLLCIISLPYSFFLLFFFFFLLLSFAIETRTREAALRTRDDLLSEIRA